MDRAMILRLRDASGTAPLVDDSVGGICTTGGSHQRQRAQRRCRPQRRTATRWLETRAGAAPRPCCPIGRFQPKASWGRATIGRGPRETASRRRRKGSSRRVDRAKVLRLRTACRQCSAQDDRGGGSAHARTEERANGARVPRPHKRVREAHAHASPPSAATCDRRFAPPSGRRGAGGAGGPGLPAGRPEAATSAGRVGWRDL